jgi:Fe-Mn family superoxide dismutase
VIKLEVPKKLPNNKLESIGISKSTNEGHLKLWQGYAEKNNTIVDDLDEIKDLKKVNSTYSEVRNQKMAQTFAYGGFINHQVFFNHLNGDGKPTKEFLSLIKDPYDNFKNFINDLKATALSSRGWAYIAYCYTHEQIINVVGDAQNTFPIWGCDLIGAIDMYEHAYFADFGTDKERYIDAILSIIDYNQVVKNIMRD